MTRIKNKEAASTQWSDLPRKLIHRIFEKLQAEDRSDVLRCAAVCVSWHSIYQDDFKRGFPPFILLSKGTRESVFFHGIRKHKDCYILFNVQRTEVHELSLPELEGRRFKPSSYGWVQAIGSDDNPHKIFLLNPFTRTRIDLPPAKDFDRAKFLNVVTSTSPRDPNCVFLATDFSCNLFVYKTGDKCWTKIKLLGELYVFTNTIFYKGEFYVVDISGTIFHVNCDAKVCYGFARRPKNSDRVSRKYLVELKGDLLLVTESASQQVEFNVYKLEFGRRELIGEVKDFGNNSILLDWHSATSLSVGDGGVTGDWKANCIYFIMDAPCNKSLGVFNMTTRNTDWIAFPGTSGGQLSWVIPFLP